MQWSPLRLVNAGWKLIYIVGGGILTFGLFRLINLIPSDIATAWLTTVIQSAWIYYATRIFRGPGELLNEPRPWWRMTARPTAGYVLGAVMLLGVGSSLFGFVREPSFLWLNITGVIEFGLFAYLYFASSIRLTRLQRASVQP